MSAAGAKSLFDAHYYQHGCGVPYERSEHWLRFFGQIADRLVSGISPRTVLDAGCAWGFLVEALRERGVEAYGVDVSEYAIGNAAEAVRPYVWVGSVLDPLPRRYDLIVCIEVLEHLAKADSERALANLCQATDDIVFSSTPADYTEATHFNVQPPEYWAELFAEQGLLRDVDFDASFIAPWSVRFRRTREPLPRLAANYERRMARLSHENGELRRVAVDGVERLANLERRLGEAESLAAAREQELQAVRLTFAWQLLEGMAPLRRRLAPAGSWRERAVRRVLATLVALIRGPRAT